MIEDGGDFEAHAPQLVVAVGGINGGDLGGVRRHWHPDWGAQPPASLLNGSHRFADGCTRPPKAWARN